MSFIKGMIHRVASRRGMSVRVLTLGIAALAAVATSHAGTYDLSADFSPSNNPNGAWTYGAKASFDGPLSPFGIKGTVYAGSVAIQYWQLIGGQEPTIYWNGTANTATGGPTLTLPPGAVWLFSGFNSSSNRYGAIRFTAPAGGSGSYLVETDVRPVYDGSPQGDTDYHVVKNGVEIFGMFLAPADRTGYTNTLSLAAGDTLEFLVGRGQDNNNYGSGLKTHVTITEVSPPPPPPQLAHDLSDDFSGVNNPNGAWSYGAKPALAGPFSRFGIHGTTPAENGVPIQYWQLVALREPTIFHNGTTSTGYAASGQVTIPPGTTYLGSGTDGQSNSYCVARFTVPESGWYAVEAQTRPVYDNLSLQGDTDFHVVRNGQELFGRYLAGSQTAVYSNVVQLVIGDTIDFMVGRGADNSGNGSGLKLEASLIRQTNPPPPPPEVAYDLSGDFSGVNNPNGAWSYGAKPALAGPFSLFGVRGLNPFEYWQLIPSQEPTIYRNGTANTITLSGGQGVFPPGTVFFFSGTDGASNGFGVVRFTVPAGASSNYLVQADVAPIYNGSLQGDTDFHVVRNGAELFGRFLAPADRSGYTNVLALAAGDTIDFMVGRGADHSGTGSGLKINLTITQTSTPPPQPPPVLTYDLSEDFSPTNNPNGAWSYGAKPAVAGPFSLFGVRGLNPFEYWQLVPNQEPTIYRNGTANTITLSGGQGVFPPGTVFFFSGTDGASNGFGVVRFTVPAGASSNYLVQADVAPIYNGSLQGDTDFHVVRNGAELFGRFLAPADRSGYTNVLALAAGDRVDFMVGRGQDNSGTGSGLKINVRITPTSVPPPPPPQNHPPMAKARLAPLFHVWPDETNKLVIAVNGEAAAVILDGSLSVDPDGDPLTYVWSDLEQAQPFASGVRATNRFELGIHTVILAVSDRKATAEDLVTFEVITLVEAVEELILMVEDSDLSRKNKRPLLATLNAAAESFGRDHLRPGLNQLRAFQEKVRAQVGRTDWELARRMARAAQDIIRAVHRQLDDEEQFREHWSESGN